MCAYHFDDIEWLSDEHLTPPSTMTIQRQPFDSANENVLCVLTKHTPGRSHLRCPPSNPLSFSTSKRPFLLTSLALFFCCPLSFSLVFFLFFFSRAAKMREMIYRYENGRQSAVSQLCKAGRVSQRNAAASRIPNFFCFQFGQG